MRVFAVRDNSDLYDSYRHDVPEDAEEDDDLEERVQAGSRPRRPIPLVIAEHRPGGAPDFHALGDLPGFSARAAERLRPLLSDVELIPARGPAGPCYVARFVREVDCLDQKRTQFETRVYSGKRVKIGIIRRWAFRPSRLRGHHLFIVPGQRRWLASEEFIDAADSAGLRGLDRLEVWREGRARPNAARRALGEAIKRYCLVSDRDLSFLARLTDLKLATIEAIVRGSRAATVDELEAIARSFGMSASELLMPAPAEALARKYHAPGCD